MNGFTLRLGRHPVSRGIGLLLLPLLMLSGCPSTTTQPTSGPAMSGYDAAGSSNASQTSSGNDAAAGSKSTRLSGDAANADPGPAAVVLDVYQLIVPKGAISRNTEFWKRVEESAVDVGTYDLLLKNSVRTGVGDNKDWPFFKDLIDNYHAVVLSGSSSPATQGNIQIPMRTKINSEDIFWITDRDILYGRTFEHCENLLTITFDPAPRLVDHCVIHVCPLVRGERRVLHFTPLDHEEPVITEVFPEQLMSLALESDIPPNHFLILGPTADPRPAESLGSVFFLHDGAAQPLESVMILVPRVIHLARMR